jgi:hypothetical protein
VETDRRGFVMTSLSRRAVLGLGVAAGAASVAGCGVRATRSITSASSTVRAGSAPTRRRTFPRVSDWKLHRVGTGHEIEGFTAPASVLPGEPVDLFLSSTGRRARVEALRVGWYEGAEAIRVWSADDVRVHDRSTDVAFDDATRTISTGWEPTLRGPTGGWPPGAYLFRLTAASGAQQYIPFVVRSPEVTGRVLLVHAVTTWQAYNTWGGYSLYQGAGGSADYDNRAYVVSLDRPFDGNGATKFLAYERPVVVLAERLGIPLAYTTSDQVDTDSHAVPVGSRGGVSRSR